MRAVIRLTLVLLALALRVGAAGTAWAAKGIAGVVNLNTAPVEVLGLLPGVGPSKATAILAYRKRRPFRTVDELVRIKGIGRKMVRRLRPHLAIAGPTTASAAAIVPGLPAPPPRPAPPAHAAVAARCLPPRAGGRVPAPAHDHPPARPFRGPCLTAR